MAEPTQPAANELVVTECDEEAPIKGKPKTVMHQHGEHLNLHTKQIKELQIAMFTFNQILHQFKEKGLDSLEQDLVNLTTRFRDMEVANKGE